MWLVVTYNDTARMICGKGNPDPQLFFSMDQVKAFIAKYMIIHVEPQKLEVPLQPHIIDDFEEVK